jgi:hypothetical protein
MRSRKPITLRSFHVSCFDFAVGSWPVAYLLLAATPAAAHTFCVSKSYDAADPEHALVQALAAAGQGGAHNAEDNTIRLVRGTYHANSPNNNSFVFSNTGTHKLDINGGYNGDCSTIIENPELTILDGDGVSPALQTSSSADVSIRWVTMQNGHTGGNGSGLVMFLTAPTSEAIVDYNIIRNNVSSFANGGISIVGSGLVYIEDNLIIGNSTPGRIGAVSIDLDNSTVYFINNTVAQNIATDSASWAVTFGSLVSTAIYASNNICWGNSTTYDFDFYGGSPQFIANDYASIDPSSDPLADGSSGNLSVDPQFVGSGSFRLSSGSPLLDVGTITPPGNLPTIDIAGNPRSFSSQVDLGAYERGNEIFKSGFDG